MKEYYLDNAATTKVDPDVRDKIFTVMDKIYGNPSSIHYVGQAAKDVVNKSRKIISDYIDAKSNEIIFTSGACEANSLAILGYMQKNPSFVFCTDMIEHKSIVGLLISEDFKKYKEQKRIEIIPVHETGHIQKYDLIEVLETVKERNMFPFVSIQAANSEIGTIQNIGELAKIIHSYNGIFHCDATQLFPYTKMNVSQLGIDMMSVSGQKLHAPKGIGFLYIKNGIELTPRIYGSQEKGIRGGTENVPYIAGLGKAIEKLSTYTNNNIFRTSMCEVRNYMYHKIQNEIDNCILNGEYMSFDHRLPNNINVSFSNIDAESLLLMLNQCGIYVSSGSACNAGDNSPSYVLKEICVPKEYIYGTIRITFGDDFTYTDADYVVEKIKYCVDTLRKFG